MVRPHLAAFAVSALAAGAIVLVPAPRSVATATAPIGFETPTVVDPIHTNGEPDIAVDPFGRIFVSGPTGTGTQRSTWFGSVGGGHPLPGEGAEAAADRHHRDSGTRPGRRRHRYQLRPHRQAVFLRPLGAGVRSCCGPRAGRARRC